MTIEKIDIVKMGILIGCGIFILITALLMLPLGEMLTYLLQRNLGRNLFYPLTYNLVFLIYLISGICTILYSVYYFTTLRK